VVLMDVHVQVFMDERARLARGSHGCACIGFFMDECARLARGSHGCACTVFPWMSVQG
jgi:hypothetical protein